MNTICEVWLTSAAYRGSISSLLLLAALLLKQVRIPLACLATWHTLDNVLLLSTSTPRIFARQLCSHSVPHLWHYLGLL